MRDERRRWLTVLVSVMLVAPLAVTAPAAAQAGGAFIEGAEPWTESDCGGDVPIVVGSDAAAQSDVYSAVTLAGVVGTDCVILAGARDGDMPASHQSRLDAAAAGGYIVGGTGAVPAAKTAGRAMTRLAGADRWATAQLVGSEARSIAGGTAPAAPAPDTPLTAPDDVRQPGVYLRGAEPWIASDCDGDVPIVVGSDAKAQSDIYSAVTLAGVIGTDCVILAGPRDGHVPVSQQARLDAAEAGGFVAGGTAAVPTAKIAGRDMTRFAGADRWATAQLVGRHASGDTTAGTSTADEPSGTLDDGDDAHSTPAASGRILESFVFACGVLGDGTTDCWWLGPGPSLVRIPDAPPGDYVSLVSQTDVDDRFMCLLRSDGDVRCWAPERQWFSPPSGTYESLQPATRAGICGLRTDRTVACWDSSRGWSTAPDGTFESLHRTASPGVCGLHADRAVTCWDRNRAWPAPSGEFAYLAPSVPGRPHAFSNCGLRDDRTVACWHARGAWDGTPSGVFAALHHDSAGDAFCGLRPEGTAVCWSAWGGEMEGTPSGTFTSLRVFDNEAACGVRSDGMTVCWDADETWTATHRVDLASMVNLYLDVCGLRSDRTAVCWHLDRTWRATPDGEFAYLMPFTPWQVCGVRVEGRVACWAPDEVLETVRDSFASVQFGNGFASWCGLKADRTVTCSFDARRRNTPRGAFTSLIIGDSFHLWCGLRTDGSIACWSFFGPSRWGDNGPKGVFESLHTFDNTICGLRTDRTIVCWDDAHLPADYHKRHQIPDGPLAAASIHEARIFGCVLSTDGRLHCWDT